MFKKVFFMTAGLIFIMAPSAFAFTVPTEASLWYQFYDVFFNEIVTGPLGFVAAGCLLGFCLYNLIKGNIFIGSVAACSAGCIAILNEVVVSTGYCLA